MVGKFALICCVFSVFILFFVRKTEKSINLDDFLFEYQQYTPNNTFSPIAGDCIWFNYWGEDYHQIISCTLSVEDDCFRKIVIQGEFNIIKSVFFAVKNECALYLGLFIEKYGRPNKGYYMRWGSSWYWKNLYVNTVKRVQYGHYFVPVTYFQLR